MVISSARREPLPKPHRKDHNANAHKPNQRTEHRKAEPVLGGHHDQAEPVLGGHGITASQARTAAFKPSGHAAVTRFDLNAISNTAADELTRPSRALGRRAKLLPDGLGHEGYMPRHDLETLTCMLALVVCLLAILLAAAAVT